MRERSWVDLAVYFMLLASIIALWAGLDRRDARIADLEASQRGVPADSAIVWVSTGRLNNIRQASRDMESMTAVMEAMYEEMIQQERRADSLEAFIREGP